MNAEHEALLAEIHLLPLSQQCVILGRFQRGKIWSEIAREMGVSRMEVDALYADAMATLARQYDDLRESGWGNNL